MSDTIFIASDHRGVALKAALREHITARGDKVIDLGPHDDQRVDAQDYAENLVEKMQAEPTAKGILICGSGIAMSIAANRYAFIRAALCYDVDAAKATREHNHANVLVLPGDRLQAPQATEILEAFLKTAPLPGRYLERAEKLGKPRKI